MKESLLTCDICKETTGETRIAVERINIATLRHGAVRKDVCEQHYALVMEKVPGFFGTFIEGAETVKKVAAKGKKRQRSTATVRKSAPAREVETSKNGNAKKGTLVNTVLSELRAYPDRTFTAKDLATAIGHDRPRLSVTLANLAKDGRVKRVGKGEYRIGSAQPTLV